MNAPITDPIVPPQPPVTSTDLPADQNGHPREKCVEATNDEDLSYDPIPPRRSFTVKVTYRFRGRGQPLPYDLDEEKGE